MRTLSELIPEGLSILKKNRLSGIPSGFECIDNLTNGWQKGEVIAVAAMPGIGKSAFLRDCLINADEPALVFTLGMKASAFASGMLAKGIGVRPEEHCSLQQKQDEEVFVDKLKRSSIYVDDTPRLDISSFKSKCAQMVEHNEVMLIAICGPIQLMTVPAPKPDSTWKEELLEVIEEIKWTAETLHVPILIESKVSEGFRLRLHDYDVNMAPDAYDLYGGDVICPSIDKIIMLHRPSYHGIEGYLDNTDINLTRCFLAKGFPADSQYVDLKMVSEYNKFEEYPKNNIDGISRH